MYATRLPLALAVSALSLAAAAPAFAEQFESNGRTVEVRYHDIDLASAEGQKSLNRRIAAAVAKVCRGSSQGEMTLCRQQALRNVREPIATAIARAEVKQDQMAAAITPDLKVAGK